MRTNVYIIACLLLASLSLNAQTIFRGTVVAAGSKTPIENAKIGITNQGVGVTSNAQGAFSYKKYHETLSDTDQLIVSAPGFETIHLNATDVRALLNRSSAIVLEKGSPQESPAITHLKIFWDISEGMQDRNLNKELIFVKQYLAALNDPKVTLEVFNKDIIRTEVWKKWDGDMDRFRESVTQQTYNAPSNYSVLSLEGADAVLLLSNGVPNYGKLNANQDIPVVPFTTVQTTEGQQYLDALARYTSGTVKYTVAQAPVVENVTPTVNRKNRIYSGEIMSLTQKISGTVKSLGKPLQGATIVVKGDLKEYTTDANGAFQVEAAAGDILLVQALGMFPKAVAVQEQNNYDIKMLPSSDQLEEVVLTAKREKIFAGDKIIEGTNEPNMPGGITSLGDFYITDKDITPDGQSLERVLRKNFKGVQVSYTEKGEVVTIFGKRPNWIVNGVMVRQGQPIPLYIPDNEILSVIIKDNPLSTNIKYGGEGDRGLQVLVTTKSYRKDAIKNTALVTGNNYTEEVEDRSVTASQVTGVITSPKGPLQGAEVVRKGSLEIAYTKADGTFNLAAKNGDILIISSLGMFTKEIAVTDKKEYAVALLPNSDLLDEVVLNVTKTAKEKLYEKKDAIANKNGFAPSVILKEEFENIAHLSLIDAIYKNSSRTAAAGQYPYRIILNTRFRQPYAVVVDGIGREASIIEQLPPSNVAMILITASPGAGTKYGIPTPNGLIDIRTQSFVDFKNRDKKPKSALVTGNDYTEEVEDRSATAVQVTGVITSGAKPLKGAAITKKGTFNEVYTDANGRFTITAAIDDVLVVSAPAMFTKEVLIETQDMGAIALTSKSNDLDEVVLEGRERVDNTVETAYGKTSGDKIGYATGEISTRNYSAGYTSLDQLIKGKVSGVTVNSGLLTGQATTYKIRGGSQSITNDVPPIWIVNGTPYQDPPSFLDVNQIDNISVLKSVVATSRYGSLAAGGAFLIKTKEANFEAKAAKNKQSALVSGNEYTGDVTGSIDTALPSYILRFRESGTPQQQFALYKKLSRTQESPLEYYVDAAQYFQTIDPKLADEVRSDLAYIARNNTKALRTLSYLYELVNDTGNIVLVNERIAKIAPSESQSYRDLALAYQNDAQYDKALELYINMLGEQIMGVNFNGLEKPLRSELSRLVALHKDKIDYSRLPNEWLRTDFKVDMRMTIDWSDKSVPFEFQFVNPQKKFFKWTHTLEETRDRLKTEQKEGFQTEEFIIDDAPAGEWLINVQYLGNEGDYVLPPFLKYTVYRNYGTPKETKEVRVIKLFKQVDKVTLGKVTM
ncbi:TonB dependent/ligand-gated channel [Dokdonia sp. MED134]|uniref:carboxypeptidase-like regulatory domain-containing protein n=1 Tax=Dokdonia sp. MED134 TaxID=313590 RepID=UPI000068CF18|nr:carboxypeptidase-like regulatory domain-containing protein [Dokdonia sp. MED134]EAQ39560.1 TonB dependent/ligand-gated channel [Dokdonia sp. MED134]